MSDPYVNYVKKYELVKSASQNLGQQLISSYGDLNQKVVLFVDESKVYAGFLIQVISERREELLEYVQKTYDNVQVFVQDSWLRLDFNNDGSVSMDDLRKSLLSLYEFLKSYDYIEKTTRIKSQVYSEAQRYYKENISKG